MEKIVLNILRNRRIQKHLSQRQMAKMLNISKPYYCQIERGNRRIDLELAVKIALIMHTNIDELFSKDFINTFFKISQENYNQKKSD